MKTQTRVIARNEATDKRELIDTNKKTNKTSIISDLCQSRSRRYLLSMLLPAFLLFLSVHTFAQSADTTNKEKKHFTSAYKTNPLIILDGVAYKGDIKSINPNDIMDVTVLTAKNATALYGKDAETGAVVIRTKKYGGALAQIGTNIHKDTTAGYKLSEPGTPYPTKPLVVLDGVIYNGDIKSIDPNTIKSIDVYKGAKAEALYGSKAAAGAIVIKTKEHQKADTTNKIKE